MAKTHKYLRDKITDLDNLVLAYEKAARSNRDCPDHLDFRENLGSNMLILQRELEAETYKRGDHHFFMVNDRKKRTAACLPFRDKIVQHAINNILDPIFDKVFYPSSYSCRIGKGTHKGVKDVQSLLRRMQKAGKKINFLKTDFKKFFPSVNIRILMTEIKRKISCSWTLRLIWHLLQNVKGGLIIGDLISQLASNVYGHILDRYAKQKLRIKHYFRYADDVVVIHESRRYLLSVKDKIKRFSKVRMRMAFSKWQAASISKTFLNFLGYRMKPFFKILRKDSIRVAKRKIKAYIATARHTKLARFLASWVGHARWADSNNLINYLEKRYAFNRCHS